MTVNLIPFPSIPDDLERLILEFAVINDSKYALKLTEVARHVRKWMEPLAYRHITLSKVASAETFARCIRIKGASFFQTHVRALCIESSAGYCLKSKIVNSVLAEILSACTCVHKLALWIRTDNPRDIEDGLCKYPDLKRLSIFGNLNLYNIPPVMSSLTHLDILVGLRDRLPDLSQFENLRFLSINYAYENPWTELSDLTQELFAKTPNFIQMVIIFVLPTSLENIPLPDSRLVLGVCGMVHDSSWKDFAVCRSHENASIDWGYNPGNTDIWELAERAIQRREEVFLEAGQSLPSASKGALGVIHNAWQDPGWYSY